MSIKSDAIVIRDETTTNANTALRVGTNLVSIADDLIAKQSEIDLNTAKISFDSASSTKLGGIEAGADVNTINSTTTSEPTGSDLVYNVVSLTQAEYDAGTPVATTFYLING
tara:strand:- start:275 stop:610 length:336 start_codon:yes stop_codon:yes gene_type:complete